MNIDAPVDNTGIKVPAPCPEVSIGHNSASFSDLDTTIEDLLPFFLIRRIISRVHIGS